MKNLFKVLAVCAALFTCFSCESNSENNEEVDFLYSEMLDAKWEIADVAGLASIEFNKSGNYIVVKEINPQYVAKKQSKAMFTRSSESSTSDDNVIFGKYAITSKDEVAMEGFGTLRVESLSDSNLSFELSINGQNEPIVVSSQKAASVKPTSNTKLLFRTWDFVSYKYYDDDEWIEMSGEEAGLSNVVFSAAGTYLVSYTDHEANLAMWRWDNEDELTINYSFDNGESWHESSTVTLTTLTSSKLVVEQKYDDDSHPSITVLKPAK